MESGNIRLTVSQYDVIRALLSTASKNANLISYSSVRRLFKNTHQYIVSIQRDCEDASEANSYPEKGCCFKC